MAKGQPEVSELLSTAEILDWQEAADRVAGGVGELLLGKTGFLENQFSLGFVEGESNYSMVPEIMRQDGQLTLSVSINGYYEGWESIFSDSATGLDEAMTRDMHLAAGLSWVDISSLAISASTERCFAEINEGGLIGHAINRAELIDEAFSDIENLSNSAAVVDLMSTGVLKGLHEYVLGLDCKKVNEINKYRYGLGVAIELLDLSKDEKEELSHNLCNHFLAVAKEYKQDAVDYLTRFEYFNEDDAKDLADRFFEKEFPVLEFASAMPMDVSGFISQSSL